MHFTKKRLTTQLYDYNENTRYVSSNKIQRMPEYVVSVINSRYEVMVSDVHFIKCYYYRKSGNSQVEYFRALLFQCTDYSFLYHP